MFGRIANFDNLLKRKGFFLFGPRMTGKSTYLRTMYPDALYLDLLKPAVFRELASHPEILEDQVRAHLQKIPSAPVIIDEIQKLPEILDEVHRLTESYRDLRFILTGSSARKIKHGGANLLAGRLSWQQFFPIVSAELGNTTDGTSKSWQDLLRVGGLPAMLSSDAPWDDLRDYIGLYLQEEIQAEGLTRSISNFSRFLDVAGACNAEQVNFTAVGNDAQIAPRTVHDYFKILEETLIGTLVPSFQHTSKRKAISSAKFYLFDVGVANALTGRSDLRPRTAEFGKALEHLIFCELRAYASYHRKDVSLYYWRTQTQVEVDFVVVPKSGQPLAVEIKASATLMVKDYRGLKALSEEVPEIRKIMVAMVSSPRETADGTQVWPVADFLAQLWQGAFF